MANYDTNSCNFNNVSVVFLESSTQHVNCQLFLELEKKKKRRNKLTEVLVESSSENRSKHKALLPGILCHTRVPLLIWSIQVSASDYVFFQIALVSYSVTTIWAAIREDLEVSCICVVSEVSCICAQFPTCSALVSCHG